MRNVNHRFKRIALCIGDIILLYAALAATLAIRYHSPDLDQVLIRQHEIPFTILFFIWIILFGAFGLYDLRFMKNSKRFLYRLLRAAATNTIIAIVLFYLLPFFEIEPRRNLFLIALLSTIFIFIWRYLFNHLIKNAHSTNVLFFGITNEAIELADYLLKNPQLGQRPVAFLSLDGTTSTSLPLPHFTAYEDLPHIVKDFGIDTIVVLREIKENKTLVSALFQVITLGIGVIEFSGYHEMLTGKVPLSLIGEIWFLENLIGIKNNLYEFFKRGGDLLLAVLVGVPALLISPAIALAIKLDSRGPIFFRQKRIGKNGTSFELIKYRSMVKNAEAMSGYKGNGPDPRHTRVGSFLRKSYLDELPQIINIVRGEMSFVGPRPERPHYVEELKQKTPFYEMRLLVTPGITGWAQINMENDASVEDAPEKMQYDLYYIKNRSFILDLLIALRTIAALLKRQGR